MRTLLRILGREKWRLLGTVLAGLVLTATVLLSLTPEYEAPSRIAITSGSPPAADKSGAEPGGPERIVSNSDVVGLLASPKFLESVAGRLKLDRDPEFRTVTVPFLTTGWAWLRHRYASLLGSDPAQRPPDADEEDGRLEEAVRALRARLSISAPANATVFAISVRSADRLKAKEMSDAVASFAVEEISVTAAAAAQRVNAQFDERLAQLKQNADLAENSVRDFRSQSGLADDADRSEISRSLTDLTAQLSHAEEQLLDRQSRLAALQRAQSSGESRGAAADLLTSPVIAALRVQESEAVRRLTEASQRYGENHPRVTEAKAELGQVQGAIAGEVRKIANSAESDLAVAQAKEKRLRDQVDSLTQQARSLDRKGDELRELQRTAGKEEALYQDLLKRSHEAQDQQARHHVDARVLASASLPRIPSYPRFAEALLVAVAIGLVVGLGWIWFIEFFDSGFRTGEQIERLTGRHLIGMIPTVAKSVLRKSSPVRFVVEQPVSVYAEALRSVQTSIALNSTEGPPKVIMITSSVPGEGKSTFSCSLAQLIARSNMAKKVVILDCDLRRSAVLKLLGAPDTGGTIDQYLTGTKKLSEVLRRNPDSGLFYVPARSDTPNSAELLASEEMRALIAALASEFDLVFLDTPPLMAVSDPRIVVGLADYVVFLVQWENTDRDLAIAALKLLADVPQQVGVVLSQVNLRRHARYGYADHGSYYSKYRDYYTTS